MQATGSKAKSKSQKKPQTKAGTATARKAPSKLGENGAKKEAKEVKTALDAMDDLFASAKRKAAASDQPQAAAKASKKPKKQKQSAAEAESTHESEPVTTQLNRDASLFSQDKQPEAKPVRFDDEGLPIYKEADLKINQGGWTELCPFDCDCCF